MKKSRAAPLPRVLRIRGEHFEDAPDVSGAELAESAKEEVAKGRALRGALEDLSRRASSVDPVLLLLAKGRASHGAARFLKRLTKSTSSARDV
jgi:hypothetical protein